MYQSAEVRSRFEALITIGDKWETSGRPLGAKWETSGNQVGAKWEEVKWESNTSQVGVECECGGHDSPFKYGKAFEFVM